MRISERLQERFWAKVDRRDQGECWPWRGTILNTGYGQISDGRASTWLSHRLAYTIAFGEIPEGLTIDHVVARGCIRRDCVNPSHLEAVTNAENNRRSGSVSAENARKPNCPTCGSEYKLVRSKDVMFRKCQPCFNRLQRARRAAAKSGVA